MGPSIPQPHDWREWRRMRALDLKRDGGKPRAIAAVLDVTEAAVSKGMATGASGRIQQTNRRPRVTDNSRCVIRVPAGRSIEPHCDFSLRQLEAEGCTVRR